MAEVKKPIVLDDTLKETNALLRTQNLFLGKMAEMPAGLEEYDVLRKIVRNGNAPDFLFVGEQIIVPWTDKAENVTYDMPLNIVHFGKIDTKGEKGIPGMFLQMHYTTPFGIQFSQYQAFYYAEDELPAGTYHVKGGTDWGTFEKDKYYQFTLTEPVPAGGQLAGFRDVSDGSAITSKTVQSFASPSATTAIETVSISIGNDGTFLGVLASNSKSPLNGLQSVAYGYNRWSESAYRQWLNSDKQDWWEPQSIYDRPPAEAATKWGFLSGFEQEFLDIIKPTKVVTAKNTIIDDGKLEETYDRFFLPSEEEIFNSPQLAGEGEVWDYWKQRLALESPTSNHPATYDEYIKYQLDAQTTAASWRLRSALLSYSGYVWYVHSPGGVYYNRARTSPRCAAACRIGG